MSKEPKYVIGTCDCETDPFEYGVVPSPFVWGFYSESEGYCNFWGIGKTRKQQYQSCVAQFIAFLESLPEPHLIYAHNGGKFDFLFLLQYAEGPCKIVNGRILEMQIGRHKLRDSYAAIPIPLAAYKKDDFDYALLALNKRQKNRSTILHYLAGDVRYLFEMVTAFRKEFGDVLTIGTAAMRALKDHHAFEEFDATTDKFFRQFYYGGRNQCFASGIVRGNWKVFDVNSMYPDCMRRMLHPISYGYNESRTLDDKTDFIIVEGFNRGGLPRKDPKHGFLNFTDESGIFHVTGHELRAALDTGTFDIQRIHAAYTFHERTSFENFVEFWYQKRLDNAALSKKFRELGDENGAGYHQLLVLFYKLILNSGYGKFCLNSDNFLDWEITDADTILDIDEWTPTWERGDITFWSKPAVQQKFYNVATGASITGAARSVLLRGLASSVRPVYCDTDSIICEDLHAELDNKKLGAWKLESTGDEICIAGKKLYALYENGKVVVDDKGKPKQASKGSRITAEQIRRVAEGKVEIFENPVPAFKFDGNHQFIKRRIQKTAWNPKPFGV